MKRPESKNGKPRRQERRRHSAEFKQEAVRLMYERRKAGDKLSQIAADLSVRPEQLRQWGHQLRSAGGAMPEGVETPQQKLQRLRRENATLRQEREFAKKVAVYFARESR
jgi:transposase